MAGLDTRGAFDGFVQGFGMMQNYRDGQDRKEYIKQQQDMQQRGLDMREQEFAAQQGDRQKQQDQQQISQFYNGWASGIEAPITPELEQAFERNPMHNPRHLFKPETEAAVQYADKLSKGEGSLFSNETVNAMNDFYAPRVNRGSGGKKRLAGMYPGQKEGSFVFELEVEDEQGNKRLAPMTMNRGVEGDDDEVAQYDIDQAIGPVMGAKSIYQALGDNREKMMGYLRSSGFLPKSDASWEQVAGPDGAIMQRNTATGEMKSLLGRKADPRATAAGSPTSKQKDYYFLKENLGMDDEAAYQSAFGGTGAVNGRVPDGVKLGLSLLNAQIKEVDSKLTGKEGMMLEDDQREALQQQHAELTERRASLAQSNGLAGVPKKQQTAKQPKTQDKQESQGEPDAADADQQIRALKLW